jgi:predicted acylesterase/phospholipase RssA
LRVPSHKTQAVPDSQRAEFRASLPADAEQRWAAGGRRIAVVLSGGGARGAYEAGVLLAFQDARLPTHILAATSIGSINAASYASHSPGIVGNAEHMVQSWSEVTPAAVGIDWTRYIFMLAGLIAATAGLGNLLAQALQESNIAIHLSHPKLTWAMLALAGVAVLLLYDHVTYVGYVIGNLLSGSAWKPDRRKLVLSLLANLVVWSCVVLALISARLHLLGLVMLLSPREKLLVAALLLALAALGWFLRQPASFASHKFLRLPLRSGLFPNYERTRFLRDRLAADGLRASPMRVIMTAAEVQTGQESYFTNTAREQLLCDPGVDPGFVQTEVEEASDLLQTVIASSAFPLAYEVVPMQRRLWTDGGIVANQPIRPAIRLGADVLFLVLMEPRQQKGVEVRTFLDMGVRAIDILMAQNLKTDLENLAAINRLCELHAARQKVRPEQVRVDLGTRTYRYVKAFTVRPEQPLAATVLDFDGKITGPAIAQGYHDGGDAVREFLRYLAGAPAGGLRYVLRFKVEEMR